MPLRSTCETLNECNEPSAAPAVVVAATRAVVWTSIKVAFGGGIIVLIFYAGWTIVTTLAPSGASANAIMRKASDILKHDPEVRGALGQR
jgi:hypothetical protein